MLPKLATLGRPVGSALGGLFCWWNMPLDSPVFCTVAELTRFLSSAGIVSFGDHDQSGTADTDVVEDAINAATAEIASFGNMWYSPASMATSRLIMRWCVIMSAYNLCMTRGNGVPKSIAAEFERITDPDRGFLVKLQKGQLQLPGIAMRAQNSPSMSNISLERWHPIRKIRVQPNSLPNDTSTTRQDKIWENFTVE